MPNYYIISNLDSDSSDSEVEYSDSEEEQQVTMTTTEAPRQAKCLKPLPLFKIEQIEPIKIDATQNEIKLLTTITPAAPLPSIKAFNDPFANVVFRKDPP